jgi:polysaccharide biosynthesis transport protein
MIEEFEVSETSASSFDIKKFLFRALSYWKFFLLLLAIGVFYVYQKNIREEFSYRLSTKISIEDDSNPLFTSNASLTFNWGGVTAKVQTMIVTLQSRSHHEKVVDRLEYYKSYLKQGRFRKQDIYKATPFRFEHDYHYGQLINTPIKITFLDANSFELEVEFASSEAAVQNYITKELSRVDVSNGVYKKAFKFGDPIELPFLKGVINLVENRKAIKGDQYFILFSDFDGVVSSYQGRTSISNTNNSPILDISLIDKNTEKIVDYLNTLVLVLSEDQLQRKNQYATNAIAFIDQQISRVKNDLSENAEALNDYRKKNKIYSLDEESTALNEKLTKLDADKEAIDRQLNYYSNLKNYLLTSNTFTEIPAPSIAGIGDANILNNVSKINDLSVQKSKLQYSVRSDASVFNDLNRQIEGLKNVLIENINAATNGLKRELQNVNSNLSRVESQFSKLPEDQQQLITIERQYTLSTEDFS